MKPDDLKKIKTFKESFLMYERTKKETEERMREAMNADGTKRWTNEDIKEKLALIQTMQDDVKDKYLYLGGKIEELYDETTEKKTVAKKTPIKVKKATPKKITPKKDEEKTVIKPVIKPTTKQVVKTVENEVKEVYKETPLISNNWETTSFKESFDVIPLPSKGECYDTNLSTIAVSYLTANDENMIVSPNLYRDGLILDYLLKAKIKNNDIDPDDLVEGDREAIILWLRATSYGTQYPITVTDNETGIEFNTEVDLTQIKHKPFVLKSDGNGYFDYVLPISKDEIKFRFLTHGDIKQIEDIEKEEQVNIKKDRLLAIVKDLDTFIENDTTLNKEEKVKLYESKRNINKWADKLESDNEFGYTHKLTNRLELSIVSINGNDDRDYISEYVRNMNVRDALALRRYIGENEPGLDYAVTVQRPESLGGGSMPVFLSLDEYLFLNIAQ